MWYLIVSIPDLCTLTYFNVHELGRFDDIMISIVILLNIIGSFMPEMFTYENIVVFIPNVCQTHGAYCFMQTYYVPFFYINM